VKIKLLPLSHIKNSDGQFETDRLQAQTVPEEKKSKAETTF
jgi:hypothetical protein